MGKIKGDYYRYLAEIDLSHVAVSLVEEAKKAYEDAREISKEQMPASNPIRLGLALNFSVFNYEILNSSEEACKFAKEAFDDAMVDFGSLSEDDAKDSAVVLQLLRDNLTVWTTKAKEDTKDRAGEA